VEKLACVQHIQISANGRYLVDLHVQVGVGRWYDMLLDVVELGQQRVELHDPNKMWLNCNLAITA
jgi:sulfopyruvate decarboxylase TPP-binding subunit